MTNELSAYNEGFRDGQAQGCTNEMHLVATHNLPLVEADLAAERIENTRLREAFVTMEKAYNEGQAELDLVKRLNASQLEVFEKVEEHEHALLADLAALRATPCPCCGACPEDYAALETADHIRESTKKVGPARETGDS